MNRLEVPQKQFVASRVSAFVLILTTLGWASETPESVLTAYMDARIANDFEAAYSLLSDEDRAAMSWSEWANTVSARGGRVRGYKSFSISRIEQAGDTAEGILRDRNEARDLEILRAGLAALGDSTPGPN